MAPRLARELVEAMAESASSAELPWHPQLQRRELGNGLKVLALLGMLLGLNLLGLIGATLGCCSASPAAPWC